MRSSSVLCLFSLYALTCAYEDVSIKDSGYDSADYGLDPIQTFISTALVAPKLNILQSSPRCNDSLYTFISPRGGAVNEPSATILDQAGHLVWTLSGYEQIYNLLAQEYLGEQYLTFWAGNDAVGGHGAGYYYMLDSSYREVKKVSAAGGLDGDLHDFRITDQGTAYFTVYEIVSGDLTELGKSRDGRVWDCLVQEINLETGELIFQWRATDHYRIAETYREIRDDGVLGRAFDFFHINSIDKDPKGNYLISSRYMHTLTYISGETGEIIWILGGKRNMFKDLSNGKATDFAYQHDARFSQDGTVVSMFDNAIDDEHQEIAPYSKGLRIKLDQEAMTAELLGEYINPHHIKGKSQGSLQILDDGNVFVGYGNAAAFTEYASDGTVLCDTHFGPENRFGVGDVMSYRAYKFEWHGWPTTKPEVAILKDPNEQWFFWVSWNGATEVDAWILQGSSQMEPDEEDWEDLEDISKTSFETKFPIMALYPRYMRVLAVDKDDIVLGMSRPLDVDQEKIWSLPPLRIEEGEIGSLKFLVGFAALTGMAVGFREAWSSWRSRRRRVHWEELAQDDIRLA